MTTFDITDAFLERLVQRGIVCMAWTQVYDPAGSVVLLSLIHILEPRDDSRHLDEAIANLKKSREHLNGFVGGVGVDGRRKMLGMRPAF